jgi:Fur family zinc uptake transcriptional regulator
MLYRNVVLEARERNRSESALSARPLSDNDRVILTTLDDAQRPLSAYDILEKARSSSIRAPTQIYRSLEKLEGQGLVHRIEALSAFIACSDRHETVHKPGFVICRGCRTVREFEAAQIHDLAREAAGPQFSVDAVSLEIFGQCESCRG